MSNIATGIGLSGKEQASTRGLEILVGAEKDMAGRRAAEKAAKDKAKQSLIDDVMKNAAFKQQYKNPYYQKKFEKVAAERMANIVAAASQGDYSTNMAVIANKEVSDLERMTRQWKVEDDNMAAIVDAVVKKPGETFIADRRTIDGKDYDSDIQFLNANAGKDGIEETVANTFGDNWYSAKIKGEDGNYAFAWNPEMVSIADPMAVFSRDIKPEDYTVEGQERDYTLGRTTKRVIPMLASQEAIATGIFNLANDQAAQRAFTLRDFSEARAENPDLRYQDWFDANVKPNPMGYMNANIEKTKQQAEAREGRFREISDTKPAPRTDSESGKAAQKVFPDGGWISNGTIYELPIRAQQSKEIGIPKGATYYTGARAKAKMSKVPDDITIEVNPVRIEWDSKDPSKGSIIYKSAFSPSGDKVSKQDTFDNEGNKVESTPSYEYMVPVNRQSFTNLVAMLGTNKEDALQRINQLSEGGPSSEIKSWIESAIGVSSEGSPGAGPSGESKQAAAQSLSGQDKAAYDWAKSNPKDPRAAQILNRLGLK